jgi:hypothetical protein
VRRVVTVGSDQSRLLLNPLEERAGGDFYHSGGKHWSSQTDSEVTADGKTLVVCSRLNNYLYAFSLPGLKPLGGAELSGKGAVGSGTPL